MMSQSSLGECMRYILYISKNTYDAQIFLDMLPSTINLQKVKIKNMMTNNNNYQTRYNPMSSSSMFTGSTNNEFKRINPFNQTSPAFDPFQRNIENKTEQSNYQPYPRAMASQSMIATNTSSSNKRTTFGLLDSMARKVTTTFKQQNVPDTNKKPENPFSSDDSISQSMISPNTGANKPFYGFSKMHDNKKLNTEPSEPAPKKRRESIDLGFSNRTEATNQMIPFMRKAMPNQSKNNEPDSPGNGLEALKQKNFEFLKKRKDMNGSQTTNSTIVPSSIHAVQSMKNLQQFYQNSGIKKPQFLSPIPKQANDVKCPQDRSKQETPVKMEHPVAFNHSNSPVSPSFQFKKKKAFEVPIEISTFKSAPAKEESNQKEPLTAKQRRNARNQREIKLSDFQLLDKLGKGAFGDVYMAQEKNIGFICVIKKMSKKRIRQMKVQNHILRQIKIQSYLNHPNLTSLFGYFHDEENLYLVIEALPDGSLQQVKKKKKLPQKQAASIIKQVSVGLKYMHQQCIIHRDLKPQNLFVNDGVIKIGDFGCSIYNQDSGLRTTVVGCLEYSSPEQLSNEGYSQKIDAWSLGILTYELLFGKSPFEKDIINITRNKQADAKLSELAFPNSISIKDQTKDFIENLLSENPDKRMDMDQVLIHDFLKQQMSKKQNKLQLI